MPHSGFSLLALAGAALATSAATQATTNAFLSASLTQGGEYAYGTTILNPTPAFGDAIDVPQLLTNADPWRLLIADGGGNVTDSFSVPVTLAGSTFHQFFPLEVIGGNLVLTASNGVAVAYVR